MSPPNSFGSHFVVTILGESHGRLVGVVIDGVPAGYPVDIEQINVEMSRRKPGQSKVTTARAEDDRVECLSGLFNGKTTGAPILLVTWNKDANPSAYEKFKDVLRPGHADYAAMLRYGGFHDYRGSGRFSGRLTAGIVMAGAIASQIFNRVIPITIGTHAREIAGIAYDGKVEIERVRGQVESNPVRCYDPAVAGRMVEAIEHAGKDKDSVGGVVECIIDGLPGGLGDPFFESVESQISAMMFSIGAVKGIEFGVGFKAARMKGSEDNDPYEVDASKAIHPVTNNAGGILGGITTGEPIVFRVVVKPTASIAKKQHTINARTRQPVDLEYEGRHDPCIVPRIVPVIEHAAAIVALDLLLGAGLVPRVAK